MALPIPVIKYRMFTRDGTAPLVGGKVYTYVAGTLNLQNTWTDSLETTLNSNPVILDQYGEADIWVGDNSYKFAVYDANDVLQFTVDNVINSGSSGSFSTVASISDLRALPSGSSNFVYVGHNAVAADMGGGVFAWNVTSTATDNNGTIVTPEADPASGRWLRQFTGPLDPRWFGTIGNDVANDAAAITSTIAAGVTLVLPVHFGPGNYKLSSSIVFTNGTAISLDSRAIFHCTGTATLTFNDPTLDASPNVHFSGTNLSVVLPARPRLPVFAEWWDDLSIAASKFSAATIVLSVATNYALTADLNLANNIILQVIDQGIIDLSGHALTLNRAPFAPARKIFVGSPTFGPLVESVDAAWFGVLGDGSDNLAACTAITLSMTNSGGINVVFPAGTFGLSGPFYIGANSNVSGQGSTTIFKTLSPFAGDGYNGTITLRSGCENALLQNFMVDGDKAHVPNTQTVQNIAYLGCANVTTRNVISKNCQQHFNGADYTSGGDGAYLAFDNLSPSAIARYLKFYDCTFDSNHRQGTSIISAYECEWHGCLFTGTTGTEPGDGLDIEPDDPSNQPVHDLRFYGCDFSGNGGRGIQIYNISGGPVMSNITFNGCSITANAVDGVSLVSAHGGINFTDCNISSNLGYGVYVSLSQDITFKGNRIYDNHSAGVDLDVDSLAIKLQSNSILRNWHEGILIKNVTNGDPLHIIDGNIIMNNSNHNANSYDGINIVGDASHPNFSMWITNNTIGNDTDVDTQGGSNVTRNGINMSANVKYVYIVGNNFYSLLTSPIVSSATNCIIELNMDSRVPLVSVSNAVASVGGQFNGPLSTADVTDSTSYSTGSMVAAGGLGIGKSAFIKDSLTIHDIRPVWISGDEPSVGFNNYYSSGWKFGTSSSSRYGAAIVMDTNLGGFDFRVTSNTGTTGQSATQVSVLTTTASELVTKVPLYVDHYMALLTTTFSNAAVPTWPAGTQVLRQIGNMSAARAVTLPASASLRAGTILTVVDQSGTVTVGAEIQINRGSADTINGATSQTLNTAYCTMSMITDGASKWTVLYTK